MRPTSPGNTWRERSAWRERATWQVKLRWWVPPSIAAAVVLGYALGFEFAAVPILGVAVAILVYNAMLSIAFSRLGRTTKRATDLERRFELIQVSLDYAAMFVLVALSGGASSPLIWFFTFHVIFAAVLFRSGIAGVFALVATGGVWLVALGQATGRLQVGEVSFSGEILFPTGHPAATFITLLAFTIAMFVTAAVTTAIVARLRRSNTAAYNAVETLMHERSVYMLQVAHNIRAPLAASISMLDVIMEGYLGDLDERQTAYLDRIVARLNAMNRTLGDLLQLALSRQRAEQATSEPVAVSAVVADVVAMFEERAGREGVGLVFEDMCGGRSGPDASGGESDDEGADASREAGADSSDDEGADASHEAGADSSDDEGADASGDGGADDHARGTVVGEVADGACVVLGDRGALSQAFENLVSNAVKYTPRGGDVRVEVRPGGAGAVAIEIRDSGIGIPAVEQPRLFSAFFRASNALDSDAPGSGLGLTLVRETVLGHDGTIDVYSVEGEGTTVVVELPSVAN